MAKLASQHDLNILQRIFTSIRTLATNLEFSPVFDNIFRLY